MRYIGSIRLEGFYTDALWGTASDEIRVVTRHQRVLDANPRALSRGIRVGMPTSEAKVVAGKEGKFVLWTEEPFREAQSYWLDVCAVHSDVIEPVDQHTVWIDLTRHPDPRLALEELREALVGATGLTVRCGLAGSRWVAEAASLWGDPLGNALRDPKEFVASLPITALPVPVESSDRLLALGYARIGQVAALEKRTLRSQFGSEADAIARYAAGKGESTVESRYPTDALTDRFYFSDAPDSWEGLENGAKALAEAMGIELTARAKMGEEVMLILEHEEGPATRVHRRFARAVSSSDSLLNAIRLMLPETIGRPVSCVRVRVSGLRDTQHVQMDLDGVRSRFDASRGVAEAIRHLQSAFGDGVVKRASELKEPRWLAVRRAWSRANGWNWA